MDGKQCYAKLSVQPSRGLVDEKFVVLVQNLLPDFHLTVHASHQCEDGHSWHAFAQYKADATGTVNGTWIRTWMWKIQEHYLRDVHSITLFVLSAVQFQKMQVWVERIRGLNRWVYCGALSQFQAANLDSGQLAVQMIPVSICS